MKTNLLTACSLLLLTGVVVVSVIVTIIFVHTMIVFVDTLSNTRNIVFANF